MLPLRRHHKAIAFSAIFCIYLLQFLINWPGVCTADSSDAMRMALGERELSNWTPIFYMLLVAPFVNFGTFIGNYDLGVALYSLAQLVATAAVLTYVFAWLCKKGFPKALCIGAFLFFALDPVFARYSITMWKDVPFSLCMVLYVLCLADIVLAKFRLSKRNVVSLVVLSLLVGLLRNNGLFVVAGALAVLAIAGRKTAGLGKVAPIAVAVPVVLILVTGPLYSACGVKPSPFRESIAIPLQQVGAVVFYDGRMTTDQERFLSGLMPLETMKSDYEETTSDGLKFNGHFNDEWMEENKAGFLKLWLELGVENPLVYLRAWLQSTEGYWNIDTDGWAVAGSGYFGEPGKSLLYEWTGIESLDRSEGDFEELRFSRLTYPFYNIAFSVWLVFTAALFSVLKGRGRWAIPLVPLIALWATMMVAAPEYCQFRYMFSFHLALPVAVGILFLPDALKAPED